MNARLLAPLCLILAVGLGYCFLTRPSATVTPVKPVTVLVPTFLPCAAAADAPPAPPRTLKLDASKPGEVAKAYAANRARWVGYADALKTKLEACQ